MPAWVRRGKPSAQAHGRRGLCTPLRWQSWLSIQHSGRSKGLDEFQGVDFDLVVTVCDSAAEACPLWLGKGKRLHHGFPDPANAAGPEDEILQAFRGVRDGMLAFLSGLFESGSRRDVDPGPTG
jgi:hypothetical protein